MSPGGILYSLSLALSLLCFVVLSVMLGYESIFLAPVPLILSFSVNFVARAVCDKDFKNWNLGRKITHCLLASIFPVASPRPSNEVNKLSFKFTLFVFILHFYFLILSANI